MAYKTCTKCQTQNGVRSFVCKQCGTAFEKVKKDVVEKEVVEKDVQDTTVETTLQDTPVEEIGEETEEKVKQFQFRTPAVVDNHAQSIKKRKTFERPDVEIARLMKDPDLLHVYPVPAGEPVDKLTSREQAYQVLGLGKRRATSLLRIAQMERYWRHVDWKYVAEVLGENVVESSIKEEEKEEAEEEIKDEKD